MATKVKPCRIKATGTPQAGYVPKYVDEDTFQWGAGGGGSGDVVVSTDTGNELSTGVALWFGTESDYSSISTPDTNTLYIQYKSDGGGGNVFEFDFTDNTGWSLTNAAISGGKLQPTQLDGRGIYDTGVDIKDANKVTIDATIYGTTGSWVGLTYLTFCDGLTDPAGANTPITGMIINYMTNNGYDKSETKVNHSADYGNDYYTMTTTKYGNGIEMPVHFELDVVNKTVTFSMNNTLIGTDTVSDADIASFKATSRTKFGVHVAQTTWYISYLKLTIE